MATANYPDLTLSLAGIFQAAQIVRDLARTGETNAIAFNTSIYSIYQIDAIDVPSIYGGVAGLKMGLQELLRLLSNDKLKADPAISRYVINITHLERKLAKQTEMMNTIARRVKYAASQANYFSDIHPNVLSSLADIYITTLGTLPFRIQVVGQAKFLNQKEILEKIRAVLLAGVRSAVLWRQLGGSRWQLFFQRTRLSKTAEEIINKI